MTAGLDSGQQPPSLRRLSGTRPLKFRLLRIELNAVGRHPLIDICDTMLEYIDSS